MNLEKAVQLRMDTDGHRAPVAEDDVAVISAYWLDGATTRSSDRKGHPIREQNYPISFKAPLDHCVPHTPAVPGKPVLGCEARESAGVRARGLQEACRPRALTRQP